MLKRLPIAFLILITGCTLSFNNIETQGHSSDVLDEQQTATPNIEPNLTIPATVL